MSANDEERMKRRGSITLNIIDFIGILTQEDS